MKKENYLNFESAMKRFCIAVNEYETQNPATMTVLEQSYQQERLKFAVSKMNDLQRMKHDDAEYLTIFFGGPAGMVVSMLWPQSKDLKDHEGNDSSPYFRDARSELANRGFDL